MTGIPTGSIEIAPGKLPCQLWFFTAPKGYTPPSQSTFFFLNIDTELVYTSFFADFGPLDLGLTVKYCQQLDCLIKQAVKEQKSVVHYTIEDDCGHFRTNSAVLLCAYLVMVHGQSAEEAYAPHFYNMDVKLTPYRDAAFATNTWPLFVVDCCRAMAKARDNGHFDFNTFDLDNYCHMQQLHNGDMSWIIPGKVRHVFGVCFFYFFGVL
jgi:cell division cycle 14